MKHPIKIFLLPLLLLFACNGKQDEILDATPNTLVADPIYSWNEGPVKESLLEFIYQSADSSSAKFIPEADRIAVFDNDGTLWSEQPYYFQLAYSIDFIKKEWANHPEWAKDPVLTAAANGDIKGILAKGEAGLLQVVMKSHAGMSSDEFARQVSDWIQNAKHPITGKHYRQMVYQPMLELLDLLRSHGYKTFIVSGGGIDFMRVFAEEVYGIPPYQIVGSSIKAKYIDYKGEPTIVKVPELNFIDDGPGKPVGIYQHIGKRPVIAVGNSDGDFEMLEYTSTGSGPRLGLLIHHTDSVREYAYDSLSHIGKLKRGLMESQSKGWLIVDMAKDWKTIYPSPANQ